MQYRFLRGIAPRAALRVSTINRVQMVVQGHMLCAHLDQQRGFASRERGNVSMEEQGPLAASSVLFLMYAYARPPMPRASC